MVTRRPLFTYKKLGYKRQEERCRNSLEGAPTGQRDLVLREEANRKEILEERGFFSKGRRKDSEKR